MIIIRVRYANLININDNYDNEIKRDVAELKNRMDAVEHLLDNAKDVLTLEEAAAVKETMNEFADTESGRISIGKWLVDYASSKAALSDLDVYHAQGEVDGVAQGRYDRWISKGNKLTY